MAITISGSTGISGVPAGGYNLVDGDMPSGAVLQVVQEYVTTSVQTTSTSETSIVSASITPTSASNKIFVRFDGSLFMYGATRLRAYLYLYRDSTNIQKYVEGYQIRELASATNEYNAFIAMSKLDSPSTTSSITYSFRVSKPDATPTIMFDGGSPNNTGGQTITLMEIAA